MVQWAQDVDGHDKIDPSAGRRFIAVHHNEIWYNYLWLWYEHEPKEVHAQQKIYGRRCHFGRFKQQMKNWKQKQFAINRFIYYYLWNCKFIVSSVVTSLYCSPRHSSWYVSRPVRCELWGLIIIIIVDVLWLQSPHWWTDGHSLRSDYAIGIYRIHYYYDSLGGRSFTRVMRKLTQHQETFYGFSCKTRSPNDTKLQTNIQFVYEIIIAI